MKKIILSSLLAAVLILGGGFYLLKNVKNTWAPFEPEKIEAFTRSYPATITGNWEPSPDHMNTILSRYGEDLKSLGVNTVSVVPEYEYISGNPSLKGPMFSFTEAKASYISLIDRAKQAGFAVLLAPNLVGAGMGDEVIPVSESDFLADSKAVALEWADIAEQRKVEFFAPLNEMDVILRANFYTGGGDDDFQSSVRVMNEWHKEVLPLLRSSFSGKLMYKHASWSRTVGVRGYDYLGVDFDSIGQTLDSFAERVSYIYREMAASAQINDTEWLPAEVWLAYSFGTLPRNAPDGKSYDAIQDDLFQITIDAYFDPKLHPRPAGYIFLAYIMPGLDIKNRPAEAVIRKFFKTIGGGTGQFRLK